MTSYSDELLLERKSQRKETRLWLQCYLANVAPSFEQCKEHFDKNDMLLTRTDYNDICKLMSKKKPDEL